MAVKFLSPEASTRMLKLAEGTYRPKVIIELKEEIEGETRATELNASITGSIDLDRIQSIVEMKLRLDGLYVDWAEGRLE